MTNRLKVGDDKVKSHGSYSLCTRHGQVAGLQIFRALGLRVPFFGDRYSTSASSAKTYLAGIQETGPISGKLIFLRGAAESPGCHAGHFHHLVPCKSVWGYLDIAFFSCSLLVDAGLTKTSARRCSKCSHTMAMRYLQGLSLAMYLSTACDAIETL